jgi:hypothetical protein
MRTPLIHRTLQRYYKKYFLVVPESSLQTLALDLPQWGSIPAWESFLDNADAMVEALPMRCLRHGSLRFT